MADQKMRRGGKRTTAIDALDIALERGDGHADGLADAVLAKHSRLIDAQIRTERLEHRNKAALIAFRTILALGALALIIGFGWMISNARTDRGLVIEALSVPPDLAQRGLTGETLASTLADKLAAIDATARSFRSPETMTVNWGNDVKIQIPETGVSIGELDAFLRRALGHQTTIGGAVFRTPQGLRLTVRVGGSGAIDQTGTDANLEAMVQKAAEGVFAKTQAYRYSKYLEFTGRTDEAMKVARDLAASSDDPKERSWAWAQISNLLGLTDSAGAIAAARRGMREDPKNALNYLNGTIAAEHLGYAKLAAQWSRKANLLGSDENSGLSEVGINQSRLNAAFDPWSESGDVLESKRRFDALSGPLYGNSRDFSDAALVSYFAALHDYGEALASSKGISDIEGLRAFYGGGGLKNGRFDLAMAMEDYPRAIALANASLAALPTAIQTPHLQQLARERFILTDLARALAFNGQNAEARALVAAFPADCEACVLSQATVAAVAGDVAEARVLRQRALALSPSPLFIHVGMAQIAVRRNQLQAALADADAAVALGPNYADGHKARGDALRRLGRIDEAVKEYARAAEIAPKWARLWIDWGVAELRLGDKAAARAKFAVADKLYRLPSDQRLLARMRPFAGG